MTNPAYWTQEDWTGLFSDQNASAALIADDEVTLVAEGLDIRDAQAIQTALGQAALGKKRGYHRKAVRR